MPEIKIEHVSGAVDSNISAWSKGKTVKNTLIEDVEDDVDEIPDSDFAKAAAIVFYKTYYGNYVVLPS